jgi:mRNA interferase ChpB
VTVPLGGTGTKTDGVVLCNQLGAVDRAARAGKFVERLPDEIMRAVTARIVDIFEFDIG